MINPATRQENSAYLTSLPLCSHCCGVRSEPVYPSWFKSKTDFPSSTFLFFALVLVVGGEDHHPRLGFGEGRIATCLPRLPEGEGRVDI
jgi:hypothetical protein